MTSTNEFLDRSTVETAQYDQSWMTSILRPFLVSVLITCLDISLMAFLRHPLALSTFQVQAMLILGIVAGVVGVTTTTLLAQPTERERRTGSYRIAELALLFTLARLVTWIMVGNWPALSELLIAPLTTLLDRYFVIGSFVVGLSWMLATQMTETLLQLGLRPEELRAFQLKLTKDRWSDTSRVDYTDRSEILKRFLSAWIIGGVLLVLLAAASQREMSTNNFFGLIRQNIEPAVMISVIVYFLTGLIILSQGQLALLRSRWTLNQIPSAEMVQRNWPLYALFFIGIIGLLAILLPLGDTFLLANILSAIIYFVYTFFVTVAQAIALILALFLSLFTGKPPPEQEEQTAPPPQVPSFAEQAPAVNEMPPWIGGTVFWIFMALLLGYAAYIYFGGKGLKFGWLTRFWRLLLERWGMLFGSYQRWRVNLKRTIPTAQVGEAERENFGLLSRLRLRNLNPTQQVRYFYLSTLQRAEKAGFPRRAAETPLQYAQRLSTDFAKREQPEKPVPEDALFEEKMQNMGELTDAFMQVRYAGEQADEGQIPYLKQIWQILKKTLNRPKNSK